MILSAIEIRRIKPNFDFHKNSIWSLDELEQLEKKIREQAFKESIAFLIDCTLGEKYFLGS